jgi:hypothetical protein
MVSGQGSSISNILYKNFGKCTQPWLRPRLRGKINSIIQLLSRLLLMVVTMINISSIEASINDDPIVPKSNPPFSTGLVRTSPKVAPNGRVKTNAIQNRSTVEILV